MRRYNPKNFARGSVNRRDKEDVRQPLYDFLVYDLAGQAALTFFNEPVGGASSKTLEDTNMDAAGQLPRGKEFLIESIEVLFFPGVGLSVGAAVATAGTPVSLEFADDMYDVGKSGYLELFIGSKAYLTVGPLMRFPQTTGMRVDAAHGIGGGDSAAAVTVKALSTEYAVWAGRPFELDPVIVLPANQNFKVTLNWPNGVVATPSGADGRIGVMLNGVMRRNSQ